MIPVIRHLLLYVIWDFNAMFFVSWDSDAIFFVKCDFDVIFFITCIYDLEVIFVIFVECAHQVYQTHEMGDSGILVRKCYSMYFTVSCVILHPLSALLHKELVNTAISNYQIVNQ